MNSSLSVLRPQKSGNQSVCRSPGQLTVRHSLVDSLMISCECGMLCHSGISYMMFYHCCNSKIQKIYGKVMNWLLVNCALFQNSHNDPSLQNLSSSLRRICWLAIHRCGSLSLSNYPRYTEIRLQTVEERKFETLTSQFHKNQSGGWQVVHIDLHSILHRKSRRFSLDISLAIHPARLVGYLD